jgi:hypothetical protein
MEIICPLGFLPLQTFISPKMPLNPQFSIRGRLELRLFRFQHNTFIWDCLFFLFSMQEKEFLVTVTIRKIDSKWWYNSCIKCACTAVTHGDSYKCTNRDCANIAMPVQRLDDVSSGWATLFPSSTQCTSFVCIKHDMNLYKFIYYILYHHSVPPTAQKCSTFFTSMFSCLHINSFGTYKPTMLTTISRWHLLFQV